MKNLVTFLILSLFLSASFVKAQTAAMDFQGPDCNGVMRHCFADLDSGKAVILHFYMPSCSSCPPPAQKIQTMANNILANFPGKIAAYAFPYNNTTSCTYSSGWVSSNGLSLYAPMDSGATQVAYYGGFGMPTIVLLGGTDHRVMFTTQSFITSDTLIMRDSILGMLTIGVNDQEPLVNEVRLFPNPSADEAFISFDLKESASVKIEVMDITGKLLITLADDKIAAGHYDKQLNTSKLPAGTYLVRINANGKLTTQNLTISH
jgi:hypothetical protein